MKKIIFALILAVLCIIAVGCSDDGNSAVDKSLTVTLLDGEHYSVMGDNKKTAEKGGTVEFEIELDRGYKVTGAQGDECKVTDELAFTQIVKFTDIKFKAVARLETQAMQTTPFAVEKNIDNAGTISVSTVLGVAEPGVYYTDDIINIAAIAGEGYRFVCWSVDNYLSDGGEFYSYEKELNDFDFSAVDKLYANFRDLADTGNMIFYQMDGGVEIDQDCSIMLEHHPRANTLTAADMRARGVDCDSRMLIGWTTEDGQFINLGSRVAVSDTEGIVLIPVWKDYTDESYFKISNGGGVRLNEERADAEDLSEIVIPNEVDGTAVTSVIAGAFANCNASVYYVPDSVTTVEDGAFENCVNLTELYISDNITSMTDEAFTGCRNFRTLHINALEKPRYSDSYYGAKMDVYDRLARDSGNGRRKVVVIGGSSVANGYSGRKTKEVLDSYGLDMDFYNLGLNATFNNFLQYEIASAYLNVGDIYIHAPESAYITAWCGDFGASVLTGDERMTIGGAYNMLSMFESNWQLLSNVTVNMYSDFISALVKVNSIKLSSRELSYADYYPLTEEGEGMRYTGEYVKPECGDSNYFGNSGYGYLNTEKCARFALEHIYYPLYEKGVAAYNTFPPLAMQVLLNWYGTELDYKYASDLYTQRVRESLGEEKVTVLLNHNDTVYDASHFSDHCMHLGYPYQLVHTEKIMTALAEDLINRQAVSQ